MKMVAIWDLHHAVAEAVLLEDTSTGVISVVDSGKCQDVQIRNIR